MASEPTTLQEAIVYFSNPDNCQAYMVARRWPSGVVICPTCGGDKVSFLGNQRKWQCSARHPKRQFTLKTGTIFEDSPLGLDKWLMATWMVTNCKNGASSWEIHRAVGVTQKTAWFMLHRIRLAMQDEAGGMLGGEVEADETFIGGKARNMHAKEKGRKLTEGKAIVAAVLERGGRVRAKVVDKRRKEQLQQLVRENVTPGSALFTDELKSYDGLSADFEHQVINHAMQYVDEQVHTNNCENFWSLLKRSLKGTYVSVEPYHLFRYVDEQAFRYNNRLAENGEKVTDAERFNLAVSQIIGKRLTYQELTGKVADGETSLN